MNRLRMLIIGMFEASFKSIAVISNNTEYTYEYILNSAKNLAETLNTIHPRRVKIALIASNSIEWIIVFIAILLSKHTLVLFSNRASKKRIYNVLQYGRISVLITDIKELDINKLYLVHSIIYINEIDFQYNSNPFINSWMHYKEEEDSTDIIVFTPRKMEMISISPNEIIDTIKVLNEKNIFSKCTNYVNYQDFTYNYVLCLLLPMLHNVTIVIPDECTTAYCIKHILKNQITEVVILTAYQFESLWREYIHNKADYLTEFLRSFGFKRLERWRIKLHLKKLFPKIETLIILNSEISVEIENTLKRLKFPYTITYGTVETCGIATYSSPKTFVKGTVGKPLTDFLKIKPNFDDSYPQLFYFKLIDPKEEVYKDIELNDVGSIDDHGNLVFESRADEILVSDYGFTISRVAERILKSLDLVSDCLLVMKDDELIVIINLDENYCDYKNYSIEVSRRIIDQQINQINAKVETFSKIDKHRIELIPFTRDSYGRILRDTPFI